MSDGLFQIPHGEEERIAALADYYMLPYIREVLDRANKYIQEKQKAKEEEEYMDYNIKELVKGNEVVFTSFRQGHFYYTLHETDKPYGTGYSFPVPLEDIGTATLLNRDKAIIFMRWIRKAIEDKTFIKI